MSKTTIISLVVVGVLVVGGYFVFGNKSANDIQDVNDEMDTEQEQTAMPSGRKMAFSEFLRQGGAYKCEISQNVNDTETKGITYINDGMIRGEYSTKIQNMDVASTIIVRDDYTYSWTSALPNTGFKIKMDANATGSASVNNPSSYGFNAEQIGDYNCESWIPDLSKFAVPTNITFTELETK